MRGKFQSAGQPIDLIVRPVIFTRPERNARPTVAIAIDASSLINLANANALELALALPEYEFLISPVVAGECHAECIAEVVRLKEKYEHIILVDDNQIDAELYLDFLQQYELGEGETECIALCTSGGHLLCCDDRKARYVASTIIGSGRVLGSLRLLKWAVDCGLTSAENAHRVYLDMKLAGGFLPNIENDWFGAY